MAVNGKNKGNNGERELAHLLSESLKSSVPFIRVPQSGAFIGGKNSQRKSSMSDAQIRNFKADIIPPDEWVRLVIECKFYRDLPYHALATAQEIPLLSKWLKELEFDCDENDVGILCFRTNNRKWSICMSTKYLEHFEIQNYSIYNGYFITGLEKFLSENLTQFERLFKM